MGGTPIEVAADAAPAAEMTKEIIEPLPTEEDASHAEPSSPQAETAVPELSESVSTTQPDDESPATQDENLGAGGVPISPSLSPWPPSDEQEHVIQDSAVEDGPEEHSIATDQPQTSSSPSAPSWASTLTPPTTVESVKRPLKTNAAPSQAKQTTNGRGDLPSFRRRDDEQSAVFHAPRPRRRPSALDYLVADSPTGIPRAALETKYRRLEMLAHTNPGPKSVSAPSVFHGRSDSLPPLPSQPMDTPSQEYMSTYSPRGEPMTPPGAYHQPMQALPPMYGSPPMTHVSAAMPDGPPQHARHDIFQANYGSEKTPMSGYELVASKLVGDLGGPPVLPIYRRFEALNHRLLLYLQADLNDLEVELRSLDRKDTTDRGCGLIPASRRHERWSNTAVSQQRTEVLGQIGYKLSQYNKLITSFRRVQELPPASRDEAQSYRSWLNRNRLIVEDETKFLDLVDDLICLIRDDQTENDFAVDDGITPMPRTADELAFPVHERKPAESDAGTLVPAKHAPGPSQEAVRTSLAQLVLAMFVALFVPIATFAVIPTFAGRIVVVALTGTSVATVLAQSGLAKLLDRGILDWVLCAGIYGGAMIIAAGILG